MHSTLRAALYATLVVAPAGAGAQVLTFEGIRGTATTAAIGSFYNGGAGPDYGIEFSSNALAICLDTPGVSCSNGSRGGLGDPASQESALFFDTGTSTFMNRAAGFTTGFSFFYSAPGTAGSFTVFDGLDGTGNVLATLLLPSTPDGRTIASCSGNAYCPFVATGVTFTGTARSVSFAGAASRIAFDDVTFGSATPGTISTVPEPGTWAMIATGLVGLAAVRRRRRAD